MIKPIRQEDVFGCGVACVAYICGLNYTQALNLFRNGKIKAQRSGFLCKDIVRVLKQLGKKYEYRYVTSKIKQKIYKERVIVFIKKSKKYPAGHYLCRAKDGWMDSWINFPKSKDIRRARAGFRKRLPGKAIYAILPI